MNKIDFKISIIIPACNEEANVLSLAERLRIILNLYKDHEIIFVDDGSSDNTLAAIKKLRENNDRIHFLSFSRNFGHQNALRAGFDFASGDCIISIDADLQHPPELITEMIGKWQEGYDIVYTIRKENENLSFFKKKTAYFFYYLLNKISDLKIEKGAADFRLLDRSVVDILRNLKENSIFYRGIISWLGFKQYSISYFPEKRKFGESKYSLKKMIIFAIDGITSFSIKPLRISTMLGVVLSSFSFGYGIYAVIIRLFTDKAISGWTSVLLSILFIGGVQLLTLGIIGEYIGKVFIESKKRPNYIIREKSFH